MSGARAPHRSTPTRRVTYLDGVARERVDWLWAGRLPAGKLVILDGDPGVGKSTVAVDIAARITTGAAWPDGAPGVDPATAILLTAEDGLGDTVRPRAEAAGADLTRLAVYKGSTLIDDDGRVVGERPPSIPRDLADLEAIIVEHHARLVVVVDVLAAFLAAQVDSHRDHDVRSALMPLARLADRTRCAVLVLRHLNKSGGPNPVYRGGGSIGIIGAARVGLLAAPDPDDDTRRILAATKSNLSAMPPALAYRLVDAPEYGCARVVWDGTTDHRAADLLAPPRHDDTAGRRREATTWLRDLLSDGPVPSRTLQQLAADAGLAWATVRRAADQLGVRRNKVGRPGTTAQHWEWRLDAAEDAQDAQPHALGIFGGAEHLRATR